MEAWRREIVELHAFFQAWVAGTSPAEETLERLTSVLADGFAMITPTGASVGREELLGRLAPAHGSHPGLEISIRRPEVRLREAPLVVATYEEWHRSREGVEARVSTAVLRSRTGLPNGFEWVHVHETWLMEAAAAGE